jgi:hypothetical protein
MTTRVLAQGEFGTDGCLFWRSKNGGLAKGLTV